MPLMRRRLAFRRVPLRRMMASRIGGDLFMKRLHSFMKRDDFHMQSFHFIMTFGAVLPFRVHALRLQPVMLGFQLFVFVANSFALLTQFLTFRALPLPCAVPRCLIFRRRAFHLRRRSAFLLGINRETSRQRRREYRKTTENLEGIAHE